MWLCSRHHRPSPELLHLAKPKPSPRNVNPPPPPIPFPPPAAGNTHSTVPAYGRDHPGASRERTPAWHAASVLRRLSGLSHAAERPHEPPACRGVCPRAVACVRRDGRGTFRCTDGARAVSVGSPARACGAAFAHAPALGTNAARTWASESLLRTPRSSGHKPGGETAGSHGPSAV